MASSPDKLRAVRLAAAAVEQSHGLLRLRIAEAHNRDGLSLRAIAEAAGISHEQVRRIVTRSPVSSPAAP